MGRVSYLGFCGSDKGRREPIHELLSDLPDSDHNNIIWDIMCLTFRNNDIDKADIL